MILQSIKKELLIVFNDLHSIAVLFIMPITFMLLMTFAMSGRQTDILDSVNLYVEKPTQQHQTLYLQYLKKLGYQFVDTPESASATLAFDNRFSDNILSNNADGLLLVNYDSTTSIPVQSIIQQHLQLSFSRLKLHLYMLDTGELDGDVPVEKQISLIISQSDTSKLVNSTNAHELLPAIAYSIPSWLIFGIFFIVLPISITLINEQHSGTLIRLKTFPVNLHSYFISKLLAFYLISIGQFIVLLFVGLRLIPLVIDSQPVAYAQIINILPFGVFICLSAVCFASIFTAMVKSFEQAIVLGGGINIILAALSGFMVPLDVMPVSLQNIAQFSPMFWSAEIIKENIFDLASGNNMMHVIQLCIFSLVSLGISSFLLNRKIRELLWN